MNFHLKTPRFDEPAVIEIGFYGKESPDDPTQTGWRVYAENGEPIGSPTVNLWSPPVFPAPGCVFIRVTDEYAGWLECFEELGFVERTGRVERAGFVERYAEECRVLLPELIGEQ